MPDDEDEAEQEYNSGPFCPHYSQFGECDERCTCGHTCGHHDADGECDECDCKKYEDAP